MYYFAYGSNMSHHQMLVQRCPGGKFIGPVILNRHWLFFDGYSDLWGGAVANIDVSADDEIWGGLFEITEEHFKALDAQEGYPKYYSRKQVDVQTEDKAKKFKAWTYYREPHPTGTPSFAYIHAVLEGARDCRLPEDYIRAAFDHYLRKKG